jgi:signal transduction histidine kinase
MASSAMNILEKIDKAALLFLEPLNPEETYSTIVHEAIKLVRANYGSIYLADNKGLLEKIYSSIPYISKIKQREKGYTYQAYKSRQSFVVAGKQVYAAHPELKKLGTKSIIYIPLFNRRKSIGVLSLGSFHEPHFNEEEISALKLFGSLASLAIRNSQLYAETERALSIRDQFIALAAHELRTPLTSINGYIQLLKSRSSKLGQTESRWIEELSWESYRLTELIRELLEINRVKSGQLQFLWKECHLKGIIHRAMTSFRFSHPGHVINFINQLEETPDTVIGDYDKLLQVISNLLDNAAKFSPTDKPISLILRSDTTKLIVEVRDQGKGIAKKDHHKVFEGFYKGLDNYKQGMGLGLLLAKFITDSHKGEIDLRSAINKGTTFEIKLPKRDYD